MPNKPLFTTIQHLARLKMELTCNEYCVADVINWAAFNPSNPSGWCYASKDYIGNSLGLSKKTTLEIIERLIKKELVEKDMLTKKLRTTSKWYDMLSLWANVGNETLPASVTKGVQHGNETLPKIGNETLPYNNIDYNNNDIKERKDKFYKLIEEYQLKNKNKYPTLLYKKFFDYWITTDDLKEENKGKMRFELLKKGDVFNISQRLSFWWSRTKEEEKSEMWRQDAETTQKSNQPNLFTDLVKDKTFH